MSALPAYRHVQTYTTLWLIMPVVSAAVVLSLLMSRPAAALLSAGVVVVSLVAPLLLLGRLVIELRGDQLQWGFGYLSWPRWRLALGEIEAVERTRAAHRSGSGIKGSRDNRLYNVTIGGPAVLLRLRDGRRITLGTPEPERLAAFIEARLAR